MDTTTTAANKLTGSLQPPAAIWLCHLRQASGYDIAIRVLGATWFLLLALAAALKTVNHAQIVSIAEFEPNAGLALLSSGCQFLFYLALFWVMLL